MASEIDIANLALGNIKARSIQNFDEESLEAQTIKLRYPLARQYLLKTNIWNFCKIVEPLAKLAVTPKEWLFAYAYPNNCLDARRIVRNDTVTADRTVFLRYWYEDYRRFKEFDKGSIPFEIGLIDGVKVILCDLDEAFLAYTSDVEDVNLYDPQFIEAFAWYLSSVIAVPIAGSEKGREMRKDAIAIYDGISREAAATNANEGKKERQREGDITDARRA